MFLKKDIMTAYEYLNTKFKISSEILKTAREIESECADIFKERDSIREYNQYKVILAMQESHLAATHFNWTTGYGYDDAGREKTEEIFSRIFHTEDALVRPVIVNGTHALTLCLQGLLFYGDTVVSVSSKPYDTLESVFGITENPHSLKNAGVHYEQIDFVDDGEFDYNKIIDRLKNGTFVKMIYIQRSKGYSRRKAIAISDIQKLAGIIKEISPKTIIMLDNCYGEFLEEKEPTEVGVDILAGSLFKNPGGGMTITGGYVCGRKDLINHVAERMTSPNIGRESGLTFGLTRSVLQGLFLSPSVVSSAVKGAIFCAALFHKYGYDVFPSPDAHRSDIVQSVGLKSAEEMKAFCKGIQSASPVDSFVSPIPSPMPGYQDDVIMAAGCFIQGSSIELSADGPIREPYTVYFQGGLTYEHSKFGAMMALNHIMNLYE